MRSLASEDAKGYEIRRARQTTLQTTGRPLHESVAMKPNTSDNFRRSKMIAAGRALLAAGLCLAAAGCETTSSPYARSAAPMPVSPAVNREYGVINTAYNTGNPVSDLDPHVPRWGDVRPNH
jgi:hypothetical protein